MSDVNGTYIDLPSGERAQQFNFSSDILTHQTQGGNGIISGITADTQVKSYLSNTGHLEVVLEGPPSEVGGEGSRSLWKNGEYQPGSAQYLPIGNQSAFENELKLITLREVRKRDLSNADGVVYPSILNMNDSVVSTASTITDDTSASSDDPLKDLEFGQVDHILQKLSLRNLKYPIDADYGNTQDYMMINQFTYKAPSRGIFFPEGEEGESRLQAGIKQAGATLLGGVRSGTPKEKAIGLVKLPMCNSLVDSNNVSWGPDQLNALTAAVASAAMGASGETLNGLANFIKTADTNKPFEEIMRGLGVFSKGIQEGLTTAVSSGGDVLSQIASGKNANINLLGQSVVGSALLNFIGLQVSPESILSRGAGVIPNSNLALLFNAPTLREFTFSWKMSPRSREEGIRINNILRFFKQGMAPKKAAGTQSGGASYFLGAPNIFDIHFKTGRSDSDFYEILDRNDSVLRIKTCACTGAAVNYTPEGMWNAYEKGQPVAITLTLRFNELEPIFDTDYDDNYFNYDPQRTDLLPVPMDAVGY
jgi:hypothetical protein